MGARELYQAGDLAAAVAAQIEEVKRHPTDVARRSLLCEWLLIQGELERADKHLDLIVHQSPELMPGVALLRQQLRAEEWRQQFFRDGRAPECLVQPQGHVRLCLEASIHLREGHWAPAQALLDEAQAQRPPVSGMCDGVRFGDLRDLDDRFPGILEVLTSTGKYYWVALEQVASISFHAPQRSLDTLWRRAALTIREDGPDGEVFIPATYFTPGQVLDDALRLGRATDWRVLAPTAEEGLTVGLGQREFLVGEEVRSIMSLSELEFD